MTDQFPAITDSPPRPWVEPALILAFWTVMAVLTAIGTVLNTRSGFLTPVFPGASVGLAFVGSYLWAALTPLVFRLTRRYGFERTHWPTRVGALLGAGVVVAIAMETVVAWLKLEVFFSPVDRDFTFRPMFGLKRLFWLDDFIVSLKLADGSVRTIPRNGDVPKLEINDPLQAHRALVPTYTDRDIHNLTAYLVTLK